MGQHVRDRILSSIKWLYVDLPKNWVELPRISSSMVKVSQHWSKFECNYILNNMPKSDCMMDGNMNFSSLIAIGMIFWKSVKNCLYHWDSPIASIAQMTSDPQLIQNCSKSFETFTSGISVSSTVHENNKLDIYIPTHSQSWGSTMRVDHVHQPQLATSRPLHVLIHLELALFKWTQIWHNQGA